MKEGRVQIVHRHPNAFEAFDEVALKALIHPQRVQRERPNRLLPTGATGDLAPESAASAAVERFAASATRSRAPSPKATKWRWRSSGRVRSKFLLGDERKAAFGAFFTLRDGRILRQSNYDCFEA